MIKKIAFLFLIYDKIENEALWQKFFEKVDPKKYVILIHYKSDKPLKFFNEFKLKNCIPTAYADISLVKAHLLLLREALVDVTVYKLVNLSGTCIPLKSFDYIYDELTNDNNSHINLGPRQQIFPRCDSVLTYVNELDIHKSCEWIIFNRKHAEICLEKSDYYLKAFNSVYAPEEHYFVSIIKRFMDYEVVYTPDLSDGAVTFVNWSRPNYRFNSNCGLKNYTEITSQELDFLFSSHSLFGRKFRTNCKVIQDTGPPLLLEDYIKYSP